MPEKKQSVHLEDTIHKHLKMKAVKENSTIERIVHNILKREFENKMVEKNEKKK